MKLTWPQNDELTRQARRAVERLRGAGHEALWVGGCVRDALLGIAAKDVDIATDATPDAVQRLWPEAASPVGAHFGVVLLRLGGVHIEVATYRTDGAYGDARHPDSVTFGSRHDDAARRDFTINALYYDPLDETVFDPVGGIDDLRRGIVRAIGKPADRFREDALRLLRAVRFAARLQMRIHCDTLAAIRENAPAIERISAERIRDELVRILTQPHPDRGLQLLDETGLLECVLPEVAAMKNVPQPARFHPEGDVFTHTVLSLRNLPSEPSVALALATLLHDVGKPPTIEFADRIRFNQHNEQGADMADAICRRLRFSNALRARVVDLVAGHMRFMSVRDMRPGRLKQMLAQEHFDEHLALHRADCLSSHRKLDNYRFCLCKIEEMRREADRPGLPDPLVRGHDLIAAGYAPGPRMGEMLEAVREAQLDGDLATRDEAMEWIRARYAPDEGTT